MSAAAASASGGSTAKMATKASAWSNLRGLVPYLARYKSAIAFLGADWLSRLVPYYEPHSPRTLAIYCLILVACIALKGVMSFATRWTLIGISRDIEFDIRNDLLDRLLVMEPEFYVRNRTGELMSRATNDLNAVRMVLGPGIMYSGTTLVTMVLAIGLMLK